MIQFGKDFYKIKAQLVDKWPRALQDPKKGVEKPYKQTKPQVLI